MKNSAGVHLSLTKPQAELQRVFRDTSEVVSAYLFGSVAEGMSTKHSDVDFAVRLKPGLSTVAKHQIRMQLIEALELVLKRDVDMVVIDDASLKMIHQVFSHGRAIFTKDERREEAFRLKKQKEYFDFQYYIEKENRDLRAFYGC